MIQPHLTLISHKICAFAQRAAIVLLEKNVAFDRIDIDLCAKPYWFINLSPTGKVPVLLVKWDDREPVTLFESVPICEYLDETLGGPRLHSNDPLIRARQRAWIEFGTSIIMDTWPYLTATDAETATIKSAAIRSKFVRLEEELGSGPYFETGRFGMVDAVFAPIFRWFDALGHVDFSTMFDGLGRVGRWRDELCERRSVQKAVGPDFAARFRDHLVAGGALLMR